MCVCVSVCVRARTSLCVCVCVCVCVCLVLLATAGHTGKPSRLGPAGGLRLGRGACRLGQPQHTWQGEPFGPDAICDPARPLSLTQTPLRGKQHRVFSVGAAAAVWGSGTALCCQQGGRTAPQKSIVCTNSKSRSLQ